MGRGGIPGYPLRLRSADSWQRPRASWGLIRNLIKLHFCSPGSAGVFQGKLMTRRIAARIFAEERQKEAVRKAAIEAALAKPPPPRVTTENWHDWHRRGWIVCPAKRQRTCSDPACSVGAKCQRMAELGVRATALRSLGGTGLAAAPGPGRVHPAWLEWCPAKGVVAYTVGSQPDLEPPRGRRGSRLRSVSGGPQRELGWVLGDLSPAKK